MWTNSKNGENRNEGTEYMSSNSREPKGTCGQLRDSGEQTKWRQGDIKDAKNSILAMETGRVQGDKGIKALMGTTESGHGPQQNKEDNRQG